MINYSPITASFKPYYKWITFNTDGELNCLVRSIEVLNLIING